MKLSLEIDLAATTTDPAEEAARILRYWAGALKETDLSEPVSMPLMDSAYAEVGRLEVR